MGRNGTAKECEKVLRVAFFVTIDIEMKSIINDLPSLQLIVPIYHSFNCYSALPIMSFGRIQSNLPLGSM